MAEDLTPKLPALQPGLTELQSCLAALFCHTEESLVLLDPDGVICLWNPAAERLFGYQSAEMVGRADTLLVPADRLGETEALRQGALRGEEQRRLATERLARDGSRVGVYLTACPVRDAGGRVVGLVEISRPLPGSPAPSQVDEAVWSAADREVEKLLAGLPPEGNGTRELAGHSPAMEEVRRQISRLGPSEATVLITGESGTGKELVARALHQASQRQGAPFIAVNCAAIPRELLESDLFGHERGAFTGAFRRKIGRLEAAAGGTVFLDEVGELPLELQPKLLRVLEERAFTRVGGVEEIPLDLRFLAAANRPLAERVRERTFREDLYFRLSAVHLVVPPLREHLEDLPLLAEVLLQRAAQRHHQEIKRLAPGAEKVLAGYDWPGNVRELANVLEQAFLLCEGAQLDQEDLAPLLKERGGSAGPGSVSADLPLEQVEAEHIRRVLEATRWHKTEAARILGIGRDTLYRKMRQYGLEG
jgi:PAS domain S-box-containing protein